MSFMQLFVEKGTWFEVECADGGSTLLPADLVGSNPEAEDFSAYCESAPESFERVEGWAARYSAPGYMDCTDWVGVFATAAEARKACVELYGNDEDEENTAETVGVVE